MTRTDPARPVLGIDLGTTYTCVATMRGRGAVVLPNSEGESTTPSVVYFAEDGTALVGSAAVARRDREPGRVVSLIKREMGRANVTVDAAGHRYHPQQVSAVILIKIVQDALRHLGLPLPETGPVADAVVAVPAYFGAAERKATAQAAALARLHLLDLVSEPVAAAVAHDLHRGGHRTAMVYDLGGGTFDVTVVRVEPSLPAKVVAITGDHRLGGADWDRRLTSLVLSQANSAADAVRGDPVAMGALMRQVEQLKIALSNADRHTALISDHPVTVTRDEYEEATADLLDRTVELTRDALELARQSGVEKIDELLLSGGMSRSPAVARALAEQLPELPPARLAHDADHTVAKGAARLAGHALGLDTSDAVDTVTAKGYGVAVVRDAERPSLGHGVLWLIPPGADVPAVRQHEVCTIRDGQRRMAIRVYESATGFVLGDLADNPADHTALVEGEITGLPAGVPKGEPVEIGFELDGNGVLHVHVRAPDTSLRLEAKVAGAMTEDEMNAPLPGVHP